MSKRPTKISDVSRPWMKSRRDKARQIQPEYHLIITEGEKTEPLYFESIKQKINKQYHGRIHISISGQGRNTLSLLAKATELVSCSPNPYRHVWVVFDTDDFPEDNIENMEPMCRDLSNDDVTYHAIWSNQCIELWFLLHFSYLHSDLHRSEFSDKLSYHLNAMQHGEYKKNRSDMYHILRPLMNDAIRNAKKLNNLNKGRSASQSKPSTRVFELIEVFKPYLSD